MFYAHFVLAKKGPLARIWLAAHWDKKLTKAHVYETNIESSVEGILQPKVKMALRTSGHLLLGIVRIYSRKAKYLLADCNEAFIKIKMAFRPGVVDLPEGNREAAIATITLPEVFHDFDAMPDITIDMDAQVSLNQSRAEDITLKEDYGTLSLMADDFDDMGFDETEVVRDAASMDDGFDHATFLLCVDPSKERSNESNPNAPSTSLTIKTNVSLDAPIKDDGFGGTVGEGLLDGETGGLFEPAGLFDDAPLDNVALESGASELNIEEKEEQIEKLQQQNNDSEEDMYDMGPGSVGAPSSPGSPGTSLNVDEEAPGSVFDLNHGCNAQELDATEGPLTVASDSTVGITPGLPNDMPQAIPSGSGIDHTTLITNEEESFALAPMDGTVTLGSERVGKTKRKRKLIVDEVKNISGEEMKTQLSDTTDIVISLDLAPPTKRLMHWKETGGVEKLFSLPAVTILSKSLSRTYQRHLITRCTDNDNLQEKGDEIDLDADIERGREDDIVGHKRKREIESVLPQDLSHLESLHLDTSRSPFPNDNSRPYASESSRPIYPNDTPQPSFSNELSRSSYDIPQPVYVNDTSRSTYVNDAPRSVYHNDTPRSGYTNDTSRPYSNDTSRPYPTETSRPYPSETSRSYPSETSRSYPSETSRPYTETPRPSYSETPRPSYAETPRPSYAETPRPAYPSATPRPSYTSDNSRPHYSNDHGMAHPSLDMPNFMQSQHHLFTPMSSHQMSDQSQQQMMSNVMSSVISHPPPAHMIQQMLQNDMNQLAHLPQMMHPMMEQGPSLHSITPSIHTVSSPAVTETYSQAVHHTVIEPVPQHLVSDSVPSIPDRMQQPSIDKQISSHSSLDEQINHPLQNQLVPDTANHISCTENNIHPCVDSQVIQANVDSQVLQNVIDDELTQPCLDEQYIHVAGESNSISAALPSADLSNIDGANVQDGPNSLLNCHAENDASDQATAPKSDTNLVNSLSNGEVHPQEKQLNDVEIFPNKSSDIHMSDDDDDFGAPSSVGPALPEEQMADETYEQFEERILTKRTVQMLHSIDSKLDNEQRISFGDIVKNHKRKQVAQKFYTFLVLKKQQAVELQQETTYGDLIITKGPKYNNVYNGN